jgi:hypothetical protein
VFTPVLAKHTKSFNLIDTLSVGVDRIQRNFEPLQRQVELWRKTQIPEDTARLIFYSAFIDGKLEAPRTLLPEVHRLYFVKPSLAAHGESSFLQKCPNYCTLNSATCKLHLAQFRLLPQAVSLDDDDNLPSCSVVEALERQEPFINQTLAYHALAMLARLFRHGKISYHGTFVSLATGRMASLPIRNCAPQEESN